MVCVEQIYKQFENIGYRICHHLVNCADLGVPQKRERVFSQLEKI